MADPAQDRRGHPHHDRDLVHDRADGAHPALPRGAAGRLARLARRPGTVAALRPWLAALVFGVLAATDGVDGYLARSRNEVTTFGKFLDPLADKLLVTAALLALVDLDVLPSWIALVIISREFIVSGLRMVASAEGQVIAASWYGKVKTFFQIVAIMLFIVKDSATLAAAGSDIVTFVNALAWVTMGIAVALTILSMVDYFRHAVTCSSVRGRSSPRADAAEANRTRTRNARLDRQRRSSPSAPSSSRVFASTPTRARSHSRSPVPATE